MPGKSTLDNPSAVQ